MYYFKTFVVYLVVLLILRIGVDRQPSALLTTQQRVGGVPIQHMDTPTCPLDHQHHDAQKQPFINACKACRHGGTHGTWLGHDLCMAKGHGFHMCMAFTFGAFFHFFVGDVASPSASRRLSERLRCVGRFRPFHRAGGRGGGRGVPTRYLQAAHLYTMPVISASNTLPPPPHLFSGSLFSTSIARLHHEFFSLL